MRKLARYGWHRDIPDHRDLTWSTPIHLKATKLPSSYDTSKYYPSVFDQGQSSSCVGNSTSAVASHARRLAGEGPDLLLSRLFIYYGARTLGGDPDVDNGSQIRDAIKVIASNRLSMADVWPFSDAFSII